MLRLTSAMLRPNSRYEKCPGNISDDWADDTVKKYIVFAIILTITFHQSGLFSLMLGIFRQCRFHRCLWTSSSITNTSETHKHKRNTQTERKRSRRTFYIPPRLDPCLSCPRTPATPSTITWPGCTSEQVYMNSVSCLFFRISIFKFNHQES